MLNNKGDKIAPCINPLSIRISFVNSPFTNTLVVQLVYKEVINDIEDDTPIGFPDIIEHQRHKGQKVAVFPVSENDWMDMGQISELEKMRIKLYGE